MKPAKGTIVRTVLVAVGIINTILQAAGADTLPFAPEQIDAVITAVYDAVVSAWALWKNNSFTAEAIAADRILKANRDENRARKAAMFGE
jgi:SPP1 family holin